ncbi:orotate phosphoribosyltransferase [Methanothermobacter sp. KEPCO 2]|uniref:orotate phosphoribosyltransferase n=1 Tax=Methanothermobacter sp. KEPCO 2 TaxID=3240977 RepID=UPI0035127CA0
MQLKGICSLCGRADFLHTCRLCGSMVCSGCYSAELGVCKLCRSKIRRNSERH